MNAAGYELLDSGGGRKLERFGPLVLARPCAQALWRPCQPEAFWAQADATFDREEGHRWSGRAALPKSWTVEMDGLRYRLSGTDFGHLGIFPEQRDCWKQIGRLVAAGAARRDRVPAVLNLFAYSGGSTLAAARAGAEVCHVDASQGMVDWARENAVLNGMTQAPIRWIADDVRKFLGRELRRGRRYDGVVLDPPTFGRGKRGEVYKLERDLPETLDACFRLLCDDGQAFVLLSAHTPGVTPVSLGNLLAQAAGARNGRIASGEMLLSGAPDVLSVPSGCFACWEG